MSGYDDEYDRRGNRGADRGSGRNNREREGGDRGGGRRRGGDDWDEWEKEPKDGGRRRGGDRGEDRRERSPRRARDASRSEERAPARGGGRRRAEKAESRSASEEAPVSRGAKGKARKEDVDDDEQVEKKAKKGKDQDEKKADDSKETKAAPAKAESSEAEKKDSGTKDPPLTVGDCKDKTISAIIKGTYTPYSENHSRTVYKKDEKSKGIDVFIYFWDERDGDDLCGWWFSPHVGGDEVWAYHPSRNHTTPPPSDWNVPHDGDIDPQFRVTARKAGNETEDRKEKAAGKEEPKAKERTDKAKDVKEKAPEKASERAQEDPYGPPPGSPADRKSRKSGATKADEPVSPPARRSSREEAKAARKESPPPRSEARRRTRDASEEPPKDEAPPARKERARKESPPARSRTPPKDGERSRKDSSKSEHLIKMDFKEKDSKADEKAADKAESGSSKPSFASRYEQRLQKQQEEREKQRAEEKEASTTKRREKPKETEAAPPRKRDVSEEKKKEKKKEESAEEEEAPKPPAKAAAPERDSSPEPEKKPEKAPPVQEKAKEPEPEEPKKKEKDEEKQPEAAPRRKRRSKDDSEDSEVKSEQEDAKPLKRKGADVEEKKPQQDDRRGGRDDDRRGGRDDDRRGGRGDDRDDDDRRGGGRGARDDDRRGGRDDDRRGGRDDDRRGGGRMDDRRGGGRMEDDRRGGRDDDRRGGGRMEDKRGGRRDDDRSPAGGQDKKGGRDDDRRGGQDRGRGEDDRRGGRDERPQRGDRDRDEPQRDERRGDRERSPPPREERKAEAPREEPKASAEDRKKQREEEDKKALEREDERKRKEKEDEERKQADAKKREEDEKDNKVDRAKKEEMRKAKETEMKRKDEELQAKRAAKRQEEDEKRKALEEERRQANAEKRKAELALRSEAEKKRDAERAIVEEAAKKQKDDEAMAVKQQQATLSVLQVLQKLSSATPENFEELKKELDEVLKTELPLCGAQEEILRAEAQRVVEYAQQYVGQVLEQRAADTKQKTEAEEKLKKSEATARDLLAQLEKLVVAAEEASENVHSTAAPLMQEITIDDDEVMKIAATVHKQGKAAMAACSFCADFITTKRPIIQEAESMQNESTQAIAALLPRIKGATRRTAEAFQKGKEHRTIVCKRTSAKRVDKKNAEVFKKYATSDDGLLTIKDLAAYAKGEFDFELPEENSKRIVSQLFPFGQSGLSVESFRTLKTAVGIARTEVRGKNRKEEKAKRQEHVEERKTVLVKQISDLMQALDGDESSVRKAETEAETLASQAGTLQADDLKERADAVEGITGSIKAKIADYRQTGLTIFNEVYATSELEVQLRAQLSSLDTRLRGYEERLQKATEMAASGRQLALYMAVSEYEGLWTEVVVKLRSLIETDSKTVEELFSHIAGVSKEDDTVQSVSTDAIFEYLKKHDTSTDRDKVDKLFLRNVAAASAEETSKKEGKDEKPAEEGKKEDGDAKMEEKADEKEKDEKEGDKAVEAIVDSEEEDDYISKDDLEKMTVPALKALCKAQELALAGKKDDLVTRLSEKYEAAAKAKQIKKDAAAAVKKLKDEAEAAEKTKKDEAEAKVAKMKEDAKETGSKSTFKGKKEVSKEEFNRIVRMYYKVARQCVLSDNLLIEKSAQIRRMEVGEVLEVFKGPCIDTSVGVYRLLAKAIKDGTTGWATIAGNQGITFLMPGGRIFTVKAAVALTVDRMDLDGTASGLVRTLKEGEFLEVMEWAKTSQSALGVTRIQARAQIDGAVGWATVTGNDGTVLLEAM